MLAWLWVLASPDAAGASSARCRAARSSSRSGSGRVYTGNAGTYYAGIETVPAALAGVLVYIYPVFVALLSLRFATRLPGRRPWIALGLAIVGVVLALGGIDLSSGDVAGRRASLLILASAVDLLGLDRPLGAAVRGAARPARPATRRPARRRASDAAVTTALMMAATATVFAVLAVALGRPLDPRTRARRRPGRTSSAIGFVASFLAIQTLYAGARRIGAAQAALVCTTEPLFIVVLAFFVLDQTLAPIQLVGAALILVGVVIAQTSPRPRGAPEPATPLEAEVEG